MTIEKFSYDQISESYDKDYFGLQATCHEAGLQQLQTADFRVSSALEIGCGTGNFLIKLRAVYPDAALSGLDPSVKMLEIAQTKIAADYYHGTVDTAGWTAGADLIVFYFVLAYESLEKLLDFSARHLAPGGRVLIGTTTMENFPRTFERCDFLDFGLLADMIETPITIAGLQERIDAHGSFRTVDHQTQMREIGFETSDTLADFIFNSGWASDISLTFREEFDALIGAAEYPYRDMFISHSLLLERA